MKLNVEEINARRKLNGKLSITTLKTDNQILDYVDWKMVDQLHNAVLNFSRTSLKYKSLYVTVLMFFIPLTLKIFPSNKMFFIPLSIFFVSLVFWLLDSSTYYYQEALRSNINIHLKTILGRHQIEDEIVGALTNKREGKGRMRRSLWNVSNLIYYIVGFFSIPISMYLLVIKKI